MTVPGHLLSQSLSGQVCRCDLPVWSEHWVGLCSPPEAAVNSTCDGVWATNKTEQRFFCVVLLGVFCCFCFDWPECCWWLIGERPSCGSDNRCWEKDYLPSWSSGSHWPAGVWLHQRSILCEVRMDITLKALTTAPPPPPPPLLPPPPPLAMLLLGFVMLQPQKLTGIALCCSSVYKKSWLDHSLENWWLTAYCSVYEEVCYPTTMRTDM